MACGAGQLPPPVPTSDGSVHYKKVDLYLSKGGEAEDYDARLIFHPATGMMSVTGENDPDFVYTAIPYSAIQSASYSNTETPRWKAGAGAALVVGIFALPLFFMKGKKHWLTVVFEGVPEHPENGLLLRLDKSNFAQIIGTFEGQTGVTVERIVED
jgi:hypothetical protein